MLLSNAFLSPSVPPIIQIANWWCYNILHCCNTENTRLVCIACGHDNRNTANLEMPHSWCGTVLGEETLDEWGLPKGMLHRFGVQGTCRIQENKNTQDLMTAIPTEGNCNILFTASCHITVVCILHVPHHMHCTYLVSCITIQMMNSEIVFQSIQAKYIFNLCWALPEGWFGQITQWWLLITHI